MMPAATSNDLVGGHLGLIAPCAEPEEARPVPGRAGDGPRDRRQACVGVLAPDVAARHDGDGVPLALIFAHQHGAGLEAPVWRFAIPREAVEDLGGLRVEPPKACSWMCQQMKRATRSLVKPFGETNGTWSARGCEGRRGRVTGCGRSRPRWLRDRMIAGSCGSSGLATGLALALGRGGLVGDAIDARAAGLVGHQGK